MAMSSAGFLVDDSRHALRWYSIVHGRITASKSVSGIKLRDHAYTPGQSLENAYPVIAQRNATSSWLNRIKPTGKVVKATLSWARRPVVDVTSLALTPTTIAVVGKSAPRVLGIVAPRTLKGTWKAAIDLTKPVRSGRLEIRNAAGHSVRSIAVKSTKDGSLRGIAWNGLDK